MSATLKWNAYADAAPDSFNVYRAVTGVVISFPNSIAAGDVFLFQATNRDVQRVTINSAATIDDVANSINQKAKGLKATKSEDGTKLFLRCTAKQNPKLKIQPCSFAANAGISSGLYTAQKEYDLVDTVVFVPDQFYYEFLDVDGDRLDWYRISSVTGGMESLPSIAAQPIIAPPSLCVVEGRISDMQNNPIAGAVVQAKVEVPLGSTDNTGLTLPGITTETDALGRWSLPLIRSQLVLFQIEAIGYNEVLVIPDASYALFKDLKPANDHLFAPGGDPLAGA